MNTKFVIFLGLIALALGSELKGQAKPLEKPHRLPEGVEVEWIEPRPFPPRKTIPPRRILTSDIKGLKKPLEKQHRLPEGVEEPQPFPARQIRSADGGSAGVNIDHSDKSGTSGTVSGKQNVYTSSDGKTSVDVGGSVSKNFDHGNTDAKVGVNVNWG